MKKIENKFKFTGIQGTSTEQKSLSLRTFNMNR